MPVTYGPEHCRPDLPVPLAPLPGVPATVRRALAGPSPERAPAVTVVWALVTAALALAATFAPHPAFSAATWLAGAYVLARVVALRLLDRAQRRFEPAWLAAQTRVLRGHGFDVLRCTVAGRVCDLTRLGDVAALARAAPGAEVVLEFGYRPAAGAQVAVERIRRRREDLEVRYARFAPDSGRVRFPEGGYVIGAGGRVTAWSLAGRVLLTPTVPAPLLPDPAAARA
ncbi:hypothetical protein [Nonomuraea roseoviolacea]|uniref:Uncharacterized protein n=1 Tax=Nonomuraea roseoviolacea subsp. carminata TaxID=160689 RepID=A0ABT1K725_9ACTN|nr:hypothetical protein [Nonomuraea roseoviolacea]MCP2349811.1 hypothetical protein [Nonomuraea roseoviolacea subsp. carminata]